MDEEIAVKERNELYGRQYNIMVLTNLYTNSEFNCVGIVQNQSNSIYNNIMLYTSTTFITRCS